MAIPALLCLAHTAFGIDPSRGLSQYIRDQWGSSKGFPGGQVYAITQTGDGYLWIGAEKGLVRFDGVNFHLFQPANTPLLPAGPVRGLVSDAQGGLWIHLGGPRILRYADGKFEDVSSALEQGEPAFTAMSRGANGEVLLSALVNGVLRYRGGKFLRLAPPVELPNFLVISLAETPDGRIWMGTRDLGLYYESHGQITNIGKGLPDRKINCLLPITNEEMWIGTDNGVVRWNGSEITGAGVASSLNHVQALSIIRDRDANVWIGTASGLFRINGQGTAALQQHNGNSAAVTALFEDREGSVWAGTSQGLERLRDNVFLSYSAADGLPSDSNGPIYAGAENRVWFAPESGGLYWLKAGQIGRVTNAGLNGDVIYSITGTKDELWIGRQKGGLTHLRYRDNSYTTETYTEARGLAQNSVYAVQRTRDGTVWAGTLSGGVSRFSGGKFTTYTTSNGLASNTIDALLEDSTGTMWFATPNGLSALSEGRWRTFGFGDGLPSEKVNSLLQDSTGVLWVGTDDGLVFFRDGRFQLPANMPASLHEQILGIVEDQIGSLWIATANHVLRVTRENLRRGLATGSDVNEYGLADGLNGSEGLKRYQSVTADSQGLIWFSLNGGLSVVNPSRLASRRSVPAIVHINAMAADGSSLGISRPIQIPSARQRISFNFQGLSLVTPERVRFRYMLDGFDHDWSNPTTAGEAVYTNLGPGSYRFHVIASNSDGVWNSAEDVLGFEISPAFWQTSWFRIALLLAVGFTALAFYRFRLHQLTRQLNVRFEERLAERTLIAQELHDTLLQGFLSASMQLDVFVDQLPPDSPAKSRLSKVLKLMRQVIEEGRNALRGLRSSSGFGSLDLEQAFSRMQQEVSTTEEIAFRVIVEGSSRPMHPVVRDEVYRIGREALVNAFRHARAKNIEVDVAYLANHLRILVRDDGCGIDPQVLHSGREGHWGLSGMRERAERIGARLKVWSRGGSGTEVELLVPSHVAFPSQSATRPASWFGKLSARLTAGGRGETKNGSGK